MSVEKKEHSKHSAKLTTKNKTETSNKSHASK